MMKMTLSWSCFLLALLGAATISPRLAAAPWDPAAADCSGNKGCTIYVSKQGDNSDGSSWQKAFHTIQAALLAVPDDKGGHRVIVRPDTYVEANLYPSIRGAAGAYNLLVGDSDGKPRLRRDRLGRDRHGLPRRGRAHRPHQADRQSDVQDRQVGAARIGPEVRRLVGAVAVRPRVSPARSGTAGSTATCTSTGSEGGIGWDMTCDKGAEFSAVVENCVGIGRFAGAAVMAHTAARTSRSCSATATS